VRDLVAGSVDPGHCPVRRRTLLYALRHAEKKNHPAIWNNNKRCKKVMECTGPKVERSE
jgi:hypothetical protein